MDGLLQRFNFDNNNNNNDNSCSSVFCSYTPFFRFPLPLIQFTAKQYGNDLEKEI